LEELKDKTRSKNNFVFVRHGESESNLNNNFSSSKGMYGDKLTLSGKKKVEEIKNEVKDVDIIFSSPLTRTSETAEILAQGKEIIFDERLTEIDFGELNGKTFDNSSKENFNEKYSDVKKRVLDFIYEIDKKFSEKKILIVSHGIVGSFLMDVEDKKENVENSKIYNFDFAPIPHDKNFELNYHRPYIDEISFIEDGKKYEFIGDVFDC
jgi:broad specificity phosphatase PhoE